MRGDFSFNGTDIYDLGLEYAPERKDTFIWGEQTFKIADESFDSHDGGYFYGTTLEPKTFTLKCFFEDKYINGDIFTKINTVFKRGTTGKLIFKKRDWCWYIATVTNVDISNITSFLNGIVTITMKAYYPFGRADKTYIDMCADMNMYRATGLLRLEDTPNANGILLSSTDSPITSQRIFYLYNGGTERAKVKLKIQGDVSSGGTLITNSANGQKISIVGMTGGEATTGSNYYMLDALTGKCVLHNNGVDEMKFVWHDYGFLELEPSYPVKRDIYVRAENNKLYAADVIRSEDISKYVKLGDDWFRITGIADDGAAIIAASELTASLPEAGTYRTNIVTLNKITVTVKGSDGGITMLECAYDPTFN